MGLFSSVSRQYEPWSISGAGCWVLGARPLTRCSNDLKSSKDHPGTHFFIDTLCFGLKFHDRVCIRHQNSSKHRVRFSPDQIKLSFIYCSHISSISST